jgi:uncharacterized damage-inducible protein DinB
LTEIQRISKLFQDLYNGSPWLEVNLADTLKKITAEEAAKKIFPNWNSVWEITNHIISWRLNVLQRVQGQALVTPEDNYIVAIADTSTRAWNQTLMNLEDSQQKWLLLLTCFSEADLEKKYAANDMSFYEHILGILQHDAYHLGQMVIMAKAIVSTKLHL